MPNDLEERIRRKYGPPAPVKDELEERVKQKYGTPDPKDAELEERIKQKYASSPQEPPVDVPVAPPGPQRAPEPTIPTGKPPDAKRGVMPFIPAPTSERTKVKIGERIVARGPGDEMDVYEWAKKKRWEENIPFVGGVLKTDRLERVQLAQIFMAGGPQAIIENWGKSRMRHPVTGKLRLAPPSPLSTIDDLAQEFVYPKKGGKAAVALAQKLIDDYVDEVIEAQLRGYTLTAEAAETVMGVLTYALEFAISGKVAGKMGAGRHLAAKGAGLLKKGAVAMLNVGERAATRTAINIPRLQADIAQRKLDGESDAVAGRKALVSGFIQNFTEELGGLAGKAVGGAAARHGLDQKTIYKVLRAVTSFGPMKKVGLDTLPGEVMEELAADIGEWTAGTSDDTAADIAKRWTSGRHWALMGLAFAPFTAVGGATGTWRVRREAKLAKDPKWVARQAEMRERYDALEEGIAGAEAAPVAVPRRYRVKDEGIVLTKRRAAQEHETASSVIKAVIDTATELDVKPVVPAAPKGADKAGRPARRRVRAQRKVAKAKLAEYKKRRKKSEPGRKAAAKNAIEQLKPLKKRGGLRAEFRAAADSLLGMFKAKSLTDAQVRKHENTIKRFEHDPKSVSPAAHRYAKYRLAEQDKPVLRDMPEKQIKIIGALAADIVAQNKFKQEQINALNKQMTLEIDAVKQSIKDDIKTLYGEKYLPTQRDEKGFVAKVRAAGQVTARAIAKTAQWVKYAGYTQESLIRTIARPGTVAHKILSQNPQVADLLGVPLIKRQATKAVVDEMERRGIDVNKWQSETIDLPLQGKATDERGNPVKSLKFTRMQLVDLFCTVLDSYSYRQLREQAAEGIKLSPVENLAVKLDADAIRGLRRGLEGLAESERVPIVEFAEWLKTEYNGRLASLFRDIRYEQTGEVQSLPDDYYPITREEEFKEDKHARKGNVMMARKGGTEAINIESALTRHGAHVNTLAEKAAKGRIEKQMNAILEDRGVQQAVRGAFVNGQYILDRLEEGRNIWNKTDMVPKKRFDKLMRFFTRAGHIGALGGNIPVGIYQTFSRNLVLSHRGIGFAKYLYAADAYNPVEIVRMDKWIRNNIPWLEERYRGSVSGIITPEVRDDLVINRYGGKGGIPHRVVKGTQSALLYHIKVGDRVTIDRIGLAIRAEGIDKGLSGKQLDNYVKWELVKEVAATQPSSDAFSLSGFHQFARKQPIAKPFVMFTAPLIKQYNQIVQAAQDFDYKRRAGTLTVEDFGNFGYRTAIPLVLNSFLVYIAKYGYDKLVAALLGVEDDKELKDILGGTMSRAWGNLPVIGPRIDAAIGFVRGEHRYDSTSNIVTSSIRALGEGGYYAHKAWGERNPRKKAKATSRSIGRFIRGGEMFGVPGGAVGPWYGRLTRKKR